MRIFLNRAAVLRLLGGLLMAWNEQGSIGHRYLQKEASWQWKEQQQQKNLASALPPGMEVVVRVASAARQDQAANHQKYPDLSPLSRLVIGDADADASPHLWDLA